jgi:hypothetical protein
MAVDYLSTLPPGTTFLSAFVHSHGYGQPSPISPPATPNIWMVSPTKFQKAAKKFYRKCLFTLFSFHWHSCHIGVFSVFDPLNMEQMMVAFGHMVWSS